MTPDEARALYDRVVALKRARGLAWWQVFTEADVHRGAVDRLRDGYPGRSPDRIAAWADRHTAPHPPHPTPDP
ncbi:hypothetical protein [Nonomuraea ceibae]|uniref:hypothetical protein n=1 Tax=Nonomuraea ceibae TaxID=1935170 RepID=UPI001C5D0812|nr:hypothetical protein [Nonomuraea ceibae]